MQGTVPTPRQFCQLPGLWGWEAFGLQAKRHPQGRSTSSPRGSWGGGPGHPSVRAPVAPALSRQPRPPHTPPDTDTQSLGLALG